MRVWWQSGQSEPVVCCKSTGTEETNTLILELRYLFVHKVLVMGLKCTVPQLLKSTNYSCWVGKVISKPPCNIFVAMLLRL
jgi:hypothetical protein